MSRRKGSIQWMTSQHAEADNVNGSTRRGRKGSAQRHTRERADKGVHGCWQRREHADLEEDKGARRGKQVGMQW